MAGRFDGELTVAGLLRVTARSRVDGSVRYGRLEVAAGGMLAGTLSVLEPPPGEATAPSVPEKPATLDGGDDSRTPAN
ncbi:MAG: polymer-forming cytoskeletal protein [Alphaproteobacteria bacterium]|nr:polymer-forming cytoskeletal protein [Alphaproteobacteria bacterium]